VANGACEGPPGACVCLPVLVYRQVSWPTWGSRTADRYMVRRRSTVRFRKGAPGCEHFSNMEPSTSFGRVAVEWQTPSRTGACDQAICCGDGRAGRLLPGEQVLGWLGTRRIQVELPHVVGSTKSDERSELWVIRVNRSSSGVLLVPGTWWGEWVNMARRRQRCSSQRAGREPGWTPGFSLLDLKRLSGLADDADSQVLQHACGSRRLFDGWLWSAAVV
jgi:hypothetical protein